MAPVILFVFNFFYPVDLRPLADYVTAQSCRALSAPLCHFWRRAFVSYATSFQVKPVEQVQLYAVQHGSGFLLSFVEPAQCEGSNDFYPKWYSMSPLSTAGVGSEVFWSLFYLFCVFIFSVHESMPQTFFLKGFPLKLQLVFSPFQSELLYGVKLLFLRVSCSLPACLLLPYWVFFLFQQLIITSL